MSNDNQKAHLDYIKAKGKFTVACNHIIFTHEQIELLEKYGHWFEALANGTLLPFNQMQENFIEVARLNEKPSNDYERTWFMYVKRRQIEAKAGSALYTPPNPEADTFYSRDMVKKMKSTMFGVTRENHRK